MLVNTDCCTVVVWVALVVWHCKMQWLCSCSGCEEHCHAKSCVLRSWLSLSVSCETLKRDPNHNVTICTPLQVSISPSIVSQVTTQSQGPVKAAAELNFFPSQMDLYHQDHLHQRHHKISFTAALLHLNQSDFGRDAVRRTDRDQIGNSLWINSNDSLSISGQSPGLIFGQYLDNSFNICPDWTEATVTYGGALRHVSPQIVSRGTTPPAETTKPPKQIAEPLKKHLWSKSQWWAARSRAPTWCTWVPMFGKRCWWWLAPLDWDLRSPIPLYILTLQFHFPLTISGSIAEICFCLVDFKSSLSLALGWVWCSDVATS